jgi:hypothetical protein
MRGSIIIFGAYEVADLPSEAFGLVAIGYTNRFKASYC